MTTTPTIDLPAARRAVDAVGALICHIADQLIEKGADRDHALNVATGYVLGCMRDNPPDDQPDAFARFCTAVDIVAATDPVSPDAYREAADAH